MNVGDTFFDPGRGLDWHLYVVVAKTPDGHVLAFNLTTHHDGCDESCVVDVGEHTYVSRKSVVAYHLTQTFPEDDLDTSLRDGSRRGHDRASSALVRKIQDGAFVSRRIKNGYKDILVAAGVRRSGLDVVMKPSRPRKPKG